VIGPAVRDKRSPPGEFSPMIELAKSGVAPRVPGTYALVLESRSDTQVQIGRRGTLLTHPGFYVYVGSACGSGGLRARLGHHLRPALRPHWHIDYLQREARPIAVWYRCGRIRREYTWAKALRNMPGSSVPLQGFGSSDCRCESHLFLIGTRVASGQSYHNEADRSSFLCGRRSRGTARRTLNDGSPSSFDARLSSSPR